MDTPFDELINFGKKLWTFIKDSAKGLLKYIIEGKKDKGCSIRRNCKYAIQLSKNKNIPCGKRCCRRCVFLDHCRFKCTFRHNCKLEIR